MKEQSSKYRGVSFFKPMGRWTATITVRGRRLVQYRDTEEKAARAYDNMAVEAKGIYAKTNFLIEEYTIPSTVVEPICEGKDIVINDSIIKSAMKVWIAKNNASYRRKRPNWIIVDDLFFTDGLFKGNLPEFYLVCENMGINPKDYFI